MEFIIENWVSISAILAVILGAFGITKAKIEAAKKEGLEAIIKIQGTMVKIKEYKSEKSDGGTKLTSDEIKEIVPMLVDTAIEVYDVAEVFIKKNDKKAVK